MPKPRPRPTPRRRQCNALDPMPCSPPLPRSFPLFILPNLLLLFNSILSVRALPRAPHPRCKAAHTQAESRSAAARCARALPAQLGRGERRHKSAPPPPYSQTRSSLALAVASSAALHACLHTTQQQPPPSSKAAAHAPMSFRELKALQDKGIHEGDVARTAYRGGVRQGCGAGAGSESEGERRPTPAAARPLRSFRHAPLLFSLAAG